jgi:transposase
MRAYSMDLRVRVLADCDHGMATSAVASTYSVCRLQQRRRETGAIAPRKARPGPKPSLGETTRDGDRLAELARAEPDLSAAEYRDRLGLACHPTTVGRALRRLGLTFKKKCSTPRSSPARTWPPGASSGGTRSCPAWMPARWCSSTRRQPRPTGRARTATRRGAGGLWARRRSAAGRRARSWGRCGPTGSWRRWWWMGR